MCAALPFKLSSRSAHPPPSRKACVSSSDTFCSDKSLFNLTWPVEMYRRTRRHRRSASWISGCLDRFNARQIEHIFPKAAHHGARHRARQPIPTRSQGEEKQSVELWAGERIVILSCALHCRCLIGYTCNSWAVPHRIKCSIEARSLRFHTSPQFISLDQANTVGKVTIFQSQHK